MGGDIRSEKYPALTSFFKTRMYNYKPWIDCPNCGYGQYRHHDKHHVYFCDLCEAEFYHSYDGYMKIVPKDTTIMLDDLENLRKV